MLIPIAVGAGLLGLGGLAAYSGLQLRSARREKYIREFVLPHGLFKKLHDKRPQIDPKHHSLVARSLRQFFLCHLKSGRRFVSMPSPVTDDLWHEFILYTRSYQCSATRRSAHTCTTCPPPRSAAGRPTTSD